LHGDADQGGRRREHDEGDDVVGAFDLQRTGRLGEQPVQGEEPDDGRGQCGREPE